jgi:IS30 family transposase
VSTLAIGRVTSSFVKRTRPVLVLHERIAARLTGKAVAETRSVTLAMFGRIDPALRKSITFDNDMASAQHALLRTMRAMATWFCDPEPGYFNPPSAIRHLRQ